MHPTFLFIPLPAVLVLWALVAVAVVAWSVWQSGWTTDTLVTALMMVVVGAGLYWIVPRLGITDAQGHPGLAIRGYGFFVAVGVLSAIGLACHTAGRLGFDHDTVMTSAFFVIGCGIVGARAFYVIEYFDEFRTTAGGEPATWGRMVAEIVSFHQGGLVVYGGFVGAVVGFLGFVAWYKKPPLPLLDAYAPAMMLGVGFGRLGCLMNGCCWGGLCSAAIALTFPIGSPPYVRHAETGKLLGAPLEPLPDLSGWRVERVEPGSPAERKGVRSGDVIVHRTWLIRPDRLRTMDALRPPNRQRPALEWTTGDGRRFVWRIEELPGRSLPVHPAQLYASANGFFLAGLLYLALCRRRREGDVFALLMTLYPISRILLERIRSDESGIAGTNLTVSQWVSLILLVAACGWWFILRPMLHRRAAL